MAKYDATQIDQTIDVWQPFYAEKLSREDARQILDNMIAYFRNLLEWDEHTEMMPEGGHFNGNAKI